MDKYVKDSDIYDIVMSQFCASSDETEAALNAIIEGTRALPPADVRPVILCRDCIFRSNEWTGCPKLNGTITGDEFFCKCGIKKREES